MKGIENEIWLPIEGYETLMEASNFGRIKYLERVYYTGAYYAVRKVASEKIVIGTIDTEGYYVINKHDLNGKSKRLKVHRLVAKAFIPLVEGKPQVNHKNGIKTDNRIENLEWVTNQENQIHSFEVLKRVSSIKKHNYNEIHKSKRVRCNTLGITFYSGLEASRQLGISSTCIYDVCNGKYLHTQGLNFNYI